MTTREQAVTLVHATAVAIGGRAVLLMGPSGSGKSDLALRLIDRGAVLVGDDYVELFGPADAPRVRPRPTIAGRLEARGVGLVDLPYLPDAPVALAVEIVSDPERLPDPATILIGRAPVRSVRLAALEASAPIKVELALKRLGSPLEAAAR